VDRGVPDAGAAAPASVAHTSDDKPA